jgi:hypothetical protein
LSVEQALSRPQLCYFEGVISAHIMQPDRLLYIVDGHASPGVSGGPVWAWFDAVGSYAIVGIVSEYRHLFGHPELPGHCFFEPINPLMEFLIQSCDQQQSTISHNRIQLSDED